MIRTSILTAALLLSTAASATTCELMGDVRANLLRAHPTTTLTKLTRDQWQFLRGISAMAPEMPPGLPLGDSALLIHEPRDAKFAVIFTDGDYWACQFMPIPDVLVKMIYDIGEGAVLHDGDGL